MKGLDGWLVVTWLPEASPWLPHVNEQPNIKKQADGWYLPKRILAYPSNKKDPEALNSVRIVAEPAHADGQCQLNLSLMGHELVVVATEEFSKRYDLFELEFWPVYERGFELRNVLQELYRLWLLRPPTDVNVAIYIRRPDPLHPQTLNLIYFEAEVDIVVELHPPEDLEEESEPENPDSEENGGIWIN